jgi:hypothetical protein
MALLLLVRTPGNLLDALSVGISWGMPCWKAQECCDFDDGRNATQCRGIPNAKRQPTRHLLH